MNISGSGIRSEKSISDRGSYRLGFACGMTALISALLLFAVPDARAGLMALLNRLFTASEAFNTYVYARFAVREGQTLIPAMILLSVIGACALIYAAARRNPLFILILAGLAVFGQVWFGLSFPALINVLYFGFLAFLLLPASRRIRRFLIFTGVIAVAVLLICVYNPGTDPSIEAMSETVRDRISGAMMQASGSMDELPQEPLGTRHMNSRSFETGGLPAETDREFRPVTIEQEEISMPDRIGQIRKAFPIVLAAAAALYLAFRFVRMEMRRKKALAARDRFLSEDNAEAVAAMFRHAADYLTFAGFGAGNCPFRDWTAGLDGHLPPEYVNRFEACVPVFEQAVFSARKPDADQRGLVKALLDDTEKLIWDRADRKGKMQLRYTLCLHK